MLVVKSAVDSTREQAAQNYAVQGQAVRMHLHDGAKGKYR
jgi:hypothetical protein